MVRCRPGMVWQSAGVVSAFQTTGTDYCGGSSDRKCSTVTFKRLKLYGYGYGDKSAFRHDFCKEGEKLTFEELTQASDDVIQRISKIKGIKTVGAMAGGDSTMNLMGGGNDSVSMYILLDEDSKVKASDVEEKLSAGRKIWTAK